MGCKPGEDRPDCCIRLIVPVTRMKKREIIRREAEIDIDWPIEDCFDEQIVKKDERGCVFLKEMNGGLGCALHEVEPRLKPQACSRYPEYGRCEFCGRYNED